MFKALLKPKSNRQKVLAAVFWVAVVAGLVLAFVYGFPRVWHVLEPLIQKTQERLSPAEVVVVVIAALALLPLVFLPGHPFVWLAAIVLGFARALPVVIAGTTLGMALPFLVTRFLWQEPCLNRLGTTTAGKAVLDVLRRAGAFRVILLMRFGPVPYSLLSYLAGIPKSVKFLPYIAASMLGQLPGNIVDVWFGNNAKGIVDLLQGEQMHIGQLLYIVLGMVASLAITIGAYLYGKQALARLRQDLDGQPESQATEGPAQPHAATEQSTPLPEKNEAVLHSHRLHEHAYPTNVVRPAGDVLGGHVAPNHS